MLLKSFEKGEQEAMTIEALLKTAVERKASDLHLTIGNPFEW